MKRLHKFLNLPSSDRRLLVGTALLLGAVRLGLRVLPFRVLQRVITKVAQAPASANNANQSSVDRLVWAVTVASRYVPKATCLTQALGAQILLGRRAHPARLRIGVARSEEGRLEAHAWLEYEDKVIVGGGELSRY